MMFLPLILIEICYLSFMDCGVTVFQKIVHFGRVVEIFMFFLINL